MKILIVNNSDGGLYIFRGPLIKRLIIDGHEVLVACPKGDYSKSIQALGAKMFHVAFFGRSTALTQTIRTVLDLHKIMRAEKPDCVHTFTHKPNIYGAFALFLVADSNVRLHLSVTGLGTLFSGLSLRTKLTRGALVLLYRLAATRSSSIVFQNFDDQKQFELFRIGKKKRYVLVNGSGVDLEEHPTPSSYEVINMRRKLQRETSLGDLDARTVILFPARALWEKGLREFYEAARLARDIFPHFLFLHLGHSSDDDPTAGLIREDLSRYARECGVHYLGFKSDIRDYMVACDLIALPSYYREGIPHSLILGLALNKVLVTTGMPGCKETVIEGWNGAVCDPRDVNSLLAALCRASLLQSHKASRSRRLCEFKYDIELQYAVLNRLYQPIGE